MWMYQVLCVQSTVCTMLAYLKTNRHPICNFYHSGGRLKLSVRTSTFACRFVLDSAIAWRGSSGRIDLPELYPTLAQAWHENGSPFYSVLAHVKRNLKTTTSLSRAWSSFSKWACRRRRASLPRSSVSSDNAMRGSRRTSSRMRAATRRRIRTRAMS